MGKVGVGAAGKKTFKQVSAEMTKAENPAKGKHSPPPPQL